MIIVKLIGGLGNQMFQYAAARQLSHDNNTKLKLDITGFNDYKLRTYNLHHFNILEDFASDKEIAQFTSNGSLKYRILNSIDRFRVYYKRKHVIEQHYHYDENMKKVYNSAYLDGYWQSEKYFKDIENIIRKEFTIKTEANVLNKTMIEKIKNSNSVSIHIRRGDYVSNQVTSQVIGFLGFEYYFKAIDQISQSLENPNFFIFSDDLCWVKENLKIKYPMTFVDHNNAETNYEDLRLMSLCKHNIIANSSFSWWGAWLNENPNKIVFAPNNWFKIDKYNIVSLLPENWIKI
ncbi:MAG: alpha-1,2-fucosyltransferase [Spirochaetota bacterium]|nr:alpha-1,2-fucosyltransferase [Spirochaetota bacterium]